VVKMPQKYYVAFRLLARTGENNAGELILQFQTDFQQGNSIPLLGLPDRFFYYRMSMTSYNELSNLICDKTLKTDINTRKSIDPVEILSVILR
jgi:hypothetical protein